MIIIPIKIIEWLKSRKIEYGHIHLSITIHQGKAVKIVKSVVEVEKYDK